MKETGITRGIDKMGRVVIPKELRYVLGLEDGDKLEVYTEDDRIILKKYQPSCEFCDNVDEIVSFKGHKICKNCMAEIGSINVDAE